MVNTLRAFCSFILDGNTTRVECTRQNPITIGRQPHCSYVVSVECVCVWVHDVRTTESHGEVINCDSFWYTHLYKLGREAIEAEGEVSGKNEQRKIYFTIFANLLGDSCVLHCNSIIFHNNHCCSSNSAHRGTWNDRQRNLFGYLGKM